MTSINRKEHYKKIVSATDKDLNACVIELSEIYLENFPNSQGCWDMYSMALYRTDRFIEAKKALSKAIKLVGEHNKQERLSWLFLRMGNIYEKSGNFSKAIEWYEKSYQADPQESTFLIYQGRMFLRKENFEKALQVFQKATECKKGYIDEAFYNLGVTYLIQRDYSSAKIYFEKALEIDPKYKEAKQQLKDITQVLEFID